MDVVTEGCTVTSQNEEHSQEQFKPEDVEELKSKLERLGHANSELTEQLEVQKNHTKQLLLGQRTKGFETRDLLSQQAKERDRQLSEITSDLLYFESCLLKSKERARAALVEKNKQIRELQRKVKQQEKQINALNRANENLLTSLHDLRDNYGERKKHDSVSRFDSGEKLSQERDAAVSGALSSSPSGVQYANGAPYQNGHHTERTTSESNDRHFQNGETQSNRWLKVPSFEQVHLAQRRTRKLSDINGRTPGTLYNMNTNTIALPRSPQSSRRLRFIPDVNKIQEEEEEEKEKERTDIVKPVLKLRKISLPAYRLPITEDDNEEFI